MNIIDKQRKDFSEEAYVQLSIAMVAVWAAEIICYHVGDTLDGMLIKDTFFQKKRNVFKNARAQLQHLIAYLDYHFEKDFDIVLAKDRIGGKSPADLVTKNANDIVQLLLIYMSRGDMDFEKRDSMKRALMNFKPIAEIDLDAIMNYYKFCL